MLGVRPQTRQRLGVGLTQHQLIPYLGAVRCPREGCCRAQALPAELPNDAIAVARQGGSIAQIAKDFGITESCRPRWLAANDVENGARPAVTKQESVKARGPKRRNRQRELENDPAPGRGLLAEEISSEWRPPLVSDPVIDGIPAAVVWLCPCPIVGVGLHTQSMHPKPDRVQFIGAGTENLVASADFYADLVHRASRDGDIAAQLERQIDVARTRLESSIRSHDSFDALAFLRMAAGPWDFTGLRESETLIETAQVAQDLVALAFLGLGLPRTQISGENSGQIDVGSALASAADIVRAASALAMIRGHSLSEPLGSLAGRFLAYELTVRGRQYTSIATELNGLLDDPSVGSLVERTLGFTVPEVRGVREAGIDLLNERFFGARDRVGDAARRGRMLESTDRDAFRADINLMLNECRLFGSVTAQDIAARTGLSQERVATILGFFSCKRPDPDAKDPIDEFVQGRRPAPWGVIEDDDGYLMLNGFLAEDELRRDIERGLIVASEGGGAAAKSWSRYDRRRAVFSEAKASEAIALLLGGAIPRWLGQKYIGPVDLADVSRFAQGAERSGVATRQFESDVLFVVDGVAICVEVKAGSVTDKSRGGNARRLARDLEKTLTEGNQQAQRLVELIRANGGVVTAGGQWVDLADVRELHSVLVMLDDMGPLSLSMNELAKQGVIASDEVPWIVSLHDLLVASRVFDHPAQFLQFLRRRRGRKLATMVTGADELDVLMWFLNGGMYFDPDPEDVAQQIPIDKPTSRADQHRFDRQPRVQLGTLTDPLDAWMYAEEGLSQTPTLKPTRREEPWVEEFLRASEESMAPGWLRFGADLVGLSGPAQQRIGYDLKTQCHAARGGTSERSLTTHGTTSVGSWLLAAAAIPSGAKTDHLPKYVDAKQYQTEASRSMLLLYRPDGMLFGSRFRGDPEPRSAERDAEIAVSPLRSLASTFSIPPPSARRNTKRLRGKRSKRRR